MKFQIVILIIAILFSFNFALNCTDDSWSEYKQNYNKTYKTDEDELHHREVFCANVKLIEEHNELYKRGETTFEMGINQFADLTSEELAQAFGHGFRSKKDHRSFVV